MAVADAVPENRDGSEDIMEIRKLDRAEHERTRSLWEQVFSEDSREFVDYYYYVKTKDNTIYTVEEESEIRAMLQLNPYPVRLLDMVTVSDYIVGVATQKEYRGRGYMRNLLIRALWDQYAQKMPFTFLMPAAEAIYSPYDFRFIYRQKQTDLTKQFLNAEKAQIEMERKRIRERDAGFLDAGRMAEFFEQNFSDCWAIAAQRTTQYYQTMVLEQQSELGGVRLVYEEDQLICMYAYAREEGLEIREPLYLEGKEMAFLASVDSLREEEEKITVYGLQEELRFPGDGDALEYREEPVIMARIVHLRELLAAMKVPKDCEICCSFAVIDPILHENSRIWKLQSSAGEESVTVCETEDSQGVLPIAALTEVLFGYKKPEELKEEEEVIFSEKLEKELKKLQCFCPVFLNEIV